MDEIDEITNRSGLPHVYISVHGEPDPPRVVVRLHVPGKNGMVNAITMRYDTSEARELAETILGTCDGIDHDVRHRGDRTV